MRIASLVPSATEILFAIGVGDRVVARTHECDYPPEAAQVPTVTSNLLDTALPPALIDAAVAASVRDEHTIYDLDSSSLAAQSPDLVVTQSLCSVCAVDGAAVARCSLEANVLSIDPTTLDGVLDGIVSIADAVERSSEGRALAARLRSRLHWISSMVSDIEAPRVAVIEWPDPLYAPGHWVPDMVEAAGGVNVFGRSAQPSRRASVEDLATARPDVVVLAFCGYRLGDTQTHFKPLTSDPGFIEATRFARTFAFDASAYFSRPGPRLVDGVEALAWALHRPHERLRPPVGRGAKLIEAGWVDLASLPVRAAAPATH